MFLVKKIDKLTPLTKQIEDFIHIYIILLLYLLILIND